MDILEYLIRLRGASEAAAQMHALGAETKRTTGEMVGMGERGGKGIALAGKGILALGAVAVGVGLEAVKMSTAFNHEMLRIRTDAGASTKELANMKAGVLDLAASGASMGQGPMSLAQGLYHLESLGIRGKDALHALRLGAEEAAISGANLADTVSALGSVLFVGIKGAGNMDHVMGLLNATVGTGNMRMQQLVESMGTGVLSSAKLAGLSLQDVTAGLAVFSDSGQNASSAAAQFATALHFLYAPTDKAKVALKSIGMASTDLAVDLHKPNGMVVALRDLRDHLKGIGEIRSAQVLNDILPGGRGRILLTELTMLDRAMQKYKQQAGIAGGFQASVAAQRQDPQTQLRMGEARVQADMIRLGNMLTPFVIPALAFVLNTGAKFLEWLLKMPQAISAVVGWFHTAGGAGTSLGNTLSSTWSQISGAAVALWNTVTKVFSGIVAAARTTFSGSFSKDLTTVAQQIAKGVGAAFNSLLSLVRAVLPAIVTIFRGGFQIIRGIVEVLAGLLTLDFGKAWQGVKDIFGGGVKVIVGILHGAVSLVANAASQVWNALKSGLVAALNWIIGGINKAIGAINSISSSVPLIGGNIINPIGTLSVGPAPSVGTAHSSGTATGPGHMRGLASAASVPAHVVHAAMAPAGDIVIKVGQHELARVQRSMIHNAMAANA